MRFEILRGRWRAMPFEILRGSNEEATVWGELARDDGAVAQRCVADDEVVGAFDDIEDFVGQSQVECHEWVSVVKVSQKRNDVHASE